MVSSVKNEAGHRPTTINSPSKTRYDPGFDCSYGSSQPSLREVFSPSLKRKRQDPGQQRSARLQNIATIPASTAPTDRLNRHYARYFLLRRKERGRTPANNDRLTFKISLRSRLRLLLRIISTVTTRDIFSFAEKKEAGPRQTRLARLQNLATIPASNAPADCLNRHYARCFLLR